MKRAICLCLALIIMIPMIPFRVQALDNRVHCRAGETFFAVFALAEDGDRPDGVMCRVQYDMDVFTLIPGIDLIGADGFSILNRHPAVILFKVSKYAPPGEYSIEATVIEAADADGQIYTDVKIAPVQIIVENAAGAAPEESTARGGEQTNAESVKKQIAVGDYVTFGHYPQTAEGNDQTPIEWLVLEVKGNQALLLSKYGLDAKPYNKDRINITWEKCTLRGWLNEDFLNGAFSTKEQEAILFTDVDNSAEQGYSGYKTDGGNNTKDKVFLLSYNEANRYLEVQHHSIVGSKNNMKSRVSPTGYAISQGAAISSSYKTMDGSAAGLWWFRSPGSDQNYAACVSSAGSLHSDDVNVGVEVVRPALWVNLDSRIF